MLSEVAKHLLFFMDFYAIQYIKVKRENELKFLTCLWRWVEAHQASVIGGIDTTFNIDEHGAHIPRR